VSASGHSLVQRSPAECGVSECDREASIIQRTWPTGGSGAVGGRGACKYSTVVIKQIQTVDLEQQ